MEGWKVANQEGRGMARERERTVLKRHRQLERVIGAGIVVSRGERRSNR